MTGFLTDTFVRWQKDCVSISLKPHEGGDKTGTKIFLLLLNSEFSVKYNLTVLKQFMYVSKIHKTDKILEIGWMWENIVSWWVMAVLFIISMSESYFIFIMTLENIN